MIAPGTPAGSALVAVRRAIAEHIAGLERAAAARGPNSHARRQPAVARRLAEGWTSLDAIGRDTGTSNTVIKRVAAGMIAAGALPAGWRPSSLGARAVSPETEQAALDLLARDPPPSDAAIAEATGASAAFVGLLARRLGRPPHPAAAKRLATMAANGTPRGNTRPHAVRLAAVQAVARLLQEPGGASASGKAIARRIRRDTGAGYTPSRAGKIAREIRAGRHDAAVAAALAPVAATTDPQREEPTPTMTETAAADPQLAPAMAPPAPPPAAPTLGDAIAYLDAEIAGLETRWAGLRTGPAQAVEARMAEAVEAYAAPQRARLDERIERLRAAFEEQVENYRASIAAHFAGEAEAAANTAEAELGALEVALRQKRDLRDGLLALFGGVAPPEPVIAVPTEALPAVEPARPNGGAGPVVVEVRRLRDETPPVAEPAPAVAEAAPAAEEAAPAQRRPPRSKIPQSDIMAAQAYLRRCMETGQPVDREWAIAAFGLGKGAIATLWRALGNDTRINTLARSASPGGKNRRGKDKTQRTMLTGDRWLVAAESAEALVRGGLTKAEASRRLGKSPGWFSTAEKRLHEQRVGQGGGEAPPA